MSDEIKWVKSPEIRGYPIGEEFGKGRYKITGQFKITGLSSTDAIITGDNPDPVSGVVVVSDEAVMINGNHHNVRFYVKRQTDGSWIVSNRSTKYDVYRLTKPYEAPPQSLQDAAEAVAVATMAEVWSDEFARRADHAYAAQGLVKLGTEIEEAENRFAPGRH